MRAEGVGPKIRLVQDHSCVLVLGGAPERHEGADHAREGLRECTGSWADLLRDCRRARSAGMSKVSTTATGARCSENTVSKAQKRLITA